MTNAEILEMLKKFEMGNFLKVKCINLSGGNSKKLSIALSVIGDPQLLFLDEPTTHLDPLIWFQIRKIVNNLRNESRLILFVTHIMEDVEQIADELIFMQEGKIMIKDTMQKIAAK